MNKIRGGPLSASQKPAARSAASSNPSPLRSGSSITARAVEMKQGAVWPPVSFQLARPEGFEPPTPWFVGAPGRFFAFIFQ